MKTNARTAVLCGVLIAIMMLAFVPAVAGTASAYSGSIQNLQINDGVLSWNAFPDAESYYVMLTGDGGSASNIVEDGQTSLNLTDFTKEKHLETGDYTYSIYARDLNDTQISEESNGIVSLTNNNPRIDSPTNLYWEHTTARWDVVEDSAYYFVFLYKYDEINDKYSSEMNPAITFSNSYNFGSRFEVGEIYYFDVQAMAKGNDNTHRNSETVRSGSKTFNKVADSLTNVTINKGQLTFDNVSGMKEIDISIGSGGGIFEKLPIDLYDLCSGNDVEDGTYDIKIRVYNQYDEPLVPEYTYAAWDYDHTLAPTKLTGTLQVTGTLKVGETLTATLTDTNNTGTLTYVWYRSDANEDWISVQNGASNTYTIEDVCANRRMIVIVTSDQEVSQVQSAQTGLIAQADAQEILDGTVTIQGTYKVGKTLTANVTSNNTGTLAYQWTRNGGNIVGATAQTYTLTEEDAGKVIRVIVSSSVETGNIQSAATSPIEEDHTAHSVSFYNTTGSVIGSIGNTYPYWVNDSYAASGTLGENGCTAYIDYENGILHLKGYDGGPIAVLDEYYNQLQIDLQGVNVITNTTDANVNIYGLYSTNGTLDITSDSEGTLTINVHGTDTQRTSPVGGIFAGYFANKTSGQVSFTGNATVNINVTNDTTYNIAGCETFGVAVYDGISFNDGASVSVTLNTAATEMTDSVVCLNSLNGNSGVTFDTTGSVTLDNSATTLARYSIVVKSPSSTIENVGSLKCIYQVDGAGYGYEKDFSNEPTYNGNKISFKKTEAADIVTATYAPKAPAPSANRVKIGEVSFNPNPYYLNGDTDTFTGTDENYNAHYDESTGVLTLDNYNGESIVAEVGSIKVNLIGTNTVTVTGNAVGIEYYGIKANNELTFTGNGTLTINVSNLGSTSSVYGASAQILRLTEAAKLIVTVQDGTFNYGLSGNSGVFIEESASFDITATANSTSYGIYAYCGEIVISSDAQSSILIKGDENSSYSHGIYNFGGITTENNNGNVTISGSGKLTVTANGIANGVAGIHSGTGLNLDDCRNENGVITLSGANVVINGCYQGIFNESYARNVESADIVLQSGAKLTIEGDVNGSYAFETTENGVLINDAQVTATVANVPVQFGNSVTYGLDIMGASVVTFVSDTIKGIYGANNTFDLSEGGVVTFKTTAEKAPSFTNFYIALGAKSAVDVSSNTYLTNTTNASGSILYVTNENNAPFVVQYKSGFTVTLYANDGNGTQKVIGDVSGTYLLPNCPFDAPAGKAFSAWAIGSALGEQKKPGQGVIVDSDTLIVAIWEDSIYTVQPVGGKTTVNGSFDISYKLSVQPDTIYLEFYNDYSHAWANNYAIAKMPDAADTLTNYTVERVHADTEETLSFRIVAYIGGTPNYSQTFTIKYTNAGFTTQPQNKVVDLGKDATVTYALNFNPENVRVERNNNGNWVFICGATATSAEISAYAEEVTNTYRIAASYDGDFYYSDSFTVQWEQPEVEEYIVSYEANGGSGTMTGDTVESGDQFTLESCTYEAPNGKQFVGWAVGSVDAEPLKQPGDKITITQVTIVYAIWEDAETYKVVYQAGIAIDLPGNENVIFGEFVAGTHIYIASNMFTAPSGKQFKEWAYIVTKGTKYQPGDDFIVTDEEEEHHFIAIWENLPELTVSYDAEYIELGSTLDGEKLNITINYDNGTKSNVDPLDVEYWYNDEQIVNPESYKFDELKDYTIKIVYNEMIAFLDVRVAQTFTFTFNANGGTGSMADATAISTNGETADYKLPACTFTAPEGQQFKGWEFELNGDMVEYGPTDVVPLEDNTQIYALWEDIPVETYTVSFNANGGTGNMASVEDVNGDYTLPANGFTAPNGKQFKGWALSENGEVIATDTINISSDTTLYAIWEDIPHAHALEAIGAKAATCTAKGNIAYWHCTSCDKYFSDENGENEITIEETVLEKIAHTPVTDEAKEATCTETGLTEGSHCSVCGTVLVEQEVIPAKGHKWGEWQVVKAATESEEGLERRVCENDKDHVEERAIPVIGHVHTLEAVEAKDATCEEKGNSAYYVCSSCHRYFRDEEGENEINAEDVTLNALGHDWGEWIVTIPAEPGVKGEETRTCNRDHDHTETREIAALPYENKTVDGVKVYEIELTQGQAKNVSGLFDEAKAENGKAELKINGLTVSFNSDAVNAIGGNDVSVSIETEEDNFTVENAELVIKVTLTGATFNNGKATVTAPFTKEIPQGKVAKVYFVSGDEKTDMNAVFADGKVTFETNHFSTYAVMYEDKAIEPSQPTEPTEPENPSEPENPTESSEPQNPTDDGKTEVKKGLSGGAIAGIVVGAVVALAGIAVGALFLLKKKKIAFTKKSAPTATTEPQTEEPKVEEPVEEVKTEEPTAEETKEPVEEKKDE